MTNPTHHNDDLPLLQSLISADPPPIRSCRFLYKLLSPTEMAELLRIEQESAGVPRRYWAQPRGAIVDTTLRMQLLTSAQVRTFLLLESHVEGEEERWMIILDRERGLAEGGPNKLTIQERIEFVRRGEDSASVSLEDERGMEDVSVRIWGWLDTATEVVEKRRIFRDGNGKWVTGELLW